MDGRCRGQDAAADLAAKVPERMPGGVPYLVCFAAAGTKLQFHAARRREAGNAAKLTPLGRALDLGDGADRAWAVLAAVNLYRLLACFGRGQESLIRPNAELAQLMRSL